MAKSALLIEMIDLLRDRPGIGVDELAALLGRSQRTVFRWLREICADLRMAVRHRDGGYYLDDGAASRGVNLNPQELLAMRLSLKSAPFVQGSPIRKHSESAWQKIRDTASWEKLESARDMAASHDVRVVALAADVPAGVVDAVDRAVGSHHRLRIVYRSQKSNRVSEYTIHPYALAFRRHSWYLVGYCLEHKKVIQLKLVRFLDAVDTGIEFEPPADFSVERYFALSWEAWAGGEPTRVRVRFSPAVARMVSEAKRHPTQVTYPQPDGSVVFEVTVSGIEEIATWIMGYGRDAVVIEPEALRKHVLEHARATVEAYSGASAPLHPSPLVGSSKDRLLPGEMEKTAPPRK